MKKEKIIKSLVVLLTVGAISNTSTKNIVKDTLLVQSNYNGAYTSNKVINNKPTFDSLKASFTFVDQSIFIPAPKLHTKMTSIENGIQTNEMTISINYSKKISGWELYVTEKSNPGKEMFIDGVGYFIHSDNTGAQSTTVLTEFNKDYTYRARVYVILKGKKYYSDWSDAINISPELKAPVLNNQFINVDNGHPTYDISIDYPSYRIDEKNYLTGWELYVTKDSNPYNETTIDGIGYFFYGEFGNESLVNVLTAFNETYKYRARVFIENEDGRIYSNYSEIMSISPELKAPILKNTYLETENGLSKYDAYIDYPSYRIDEKNYLTGWELYVTTDENPGDEMIIDGVGYFLHSENGNETVREILVDSTRVFKYRARVYIENEDGRVYSDFSDVMTVTGK